MTSHSKPERDDPIAVGRTSNDNDPARELPDDYSEWEDYVPDGIHISEAERQRLHIEHEKYVAELIEEVGEPTPEEMAEAEAWWRPISKHLRRSSRR